MKDKMYEFVIKIFRGKDNWEKSRIRKTIHPILLRIYIFFKSSSFYMKYCRGIFYKNTTVETLQRRPLDWRDYFGELQNLFRVRIPLLECNMGMVCTLKCKDCNQCNYLLKDKRFFDTDSVINNFDKIISVVDYIQSVSIAGGEVFKAPHLEKIIEHVANCNKVGCVVVVTNGTVIPTEDVFKALVHKKVMLSISNYPLGEEFWENRDYLYRECAKRQIHFMNNNKVDQWTDIGEPYRRNKTSLEERETYADCWLKDVLSLVDGKLFRCEKIYVLDNLGLRKLQKGDFVDVEKVNRTQLRREIKKLYKIHTLDACNYCNSPKDRVLIPSGIQVED